MMGPRPNPKRQAVLVLLALVGVAIGYGLGLVFNRPPPATLPIIQSQLNPVSNQLRPSQPQPVFPEIQPNQPDRKLRAYEEALPKEIVVTMKIIPAEREEAVEAENAGPTIVGAKNLTESGVALDRRPRIAIVIDDLGIDRLRSQRAVGLPSPMTMSFLTYAKELKEQTFAARQAGHELWMHIPMEPESVDVDPGPNVLLSGMPEPVLQANLVWHLEQFDGYIGINNHMGSRFTADMDGMVLVMRELKNRDLFFFDSLTARHSAGHAAASRIGVPFLTRNVFLDHVDDSAEIKARLTEVEKLAKQQGFASAIGHPRDATLEALAIWLATVEQRGFQLVPLSSLFTPRKVPG